MMQTFYLYLYLYIYLYQWMNFPGDSAIKSLPAMQESQEMQIQSLGREDPLQP